MGGEVWTKNNPAIAAGSIFSVFPISLVGFSGNGESRVLVLLENWIVGFSFQKLDKTGLFMFWIGKDRVDYCDVKIEAVCK